jgi:hypothetical protein
MLSGGLCTSILFCTAGAAGGAARTAGAHHFAAMPGPEIKKDVRGGNYAGNPMTAFGSTNPKCGYNRQRDAPTHLVEASVLEDFAAVLLQPRQVELGRHAARQRQLIACTQSKARPQSADIGAPAACRRSCACEQGDA